MVVFVCLKGLILFILFWECESKFFEIKGLKSQRRSGVGTLNAENDIEDTKTSDPKETNKGTTEDSQMIRLTNISINSLPTQKNSVNNASREIDTATKIERDNIALDLNELKSTNATIQDNKPLQETHVLKSIEESTVPVAVVNDSSTDNISIVTALVINNASTKEDITLLSNNEPDNKTVTTMATTVPSQISTNETTTDDSQLDISIKMKASDDSLSIIDIKTSSKQSNDKIDSNSISTILRNFAKRFMKLMKGFFSFKRFNDEEDERPEDNYNLYVPISEDVSRTQYNSAEKQHVNVLREGALSLLGNDRNDM